MESSDRRQSFAYTNTVNIPVKRNAHHAQLPATPCVRTMSVTRFGVSHENVQATIETPRSHHGIERPERKKSSALFEARFAAHAPITITLSRKATMIVQSRLVRIFIFFFLLIVQLLQVLLPGTT